MQPAAIEPETKDWTFVITSGCDECGFDAQAVTPDVVGPRLRATVPRWATALGRADVAMRPSPLVWSTLEYAAHVADVCRTSRGRLALMLTQDDPEFANWDQDTAAVLARYWAQPPAAVSEDFAREAEATAIAFDAVVPQQWARTGRRDNGSLFTVATFSTYVLHDIEHHLHDVGA